MKKSRGVLVLALTAIVTALLIFTSAVGFGLQEQARQRTLRPVWICPVVSALLIRHQKSHLQKMKWLIPFI